MSYGWPAPGGWYAMRRAADSPMWRGINAALLAREQKFARDELARARKEEARRKARECDAE